MDDPRLSALRALRDCRVLRTRTDHAALIALQEEGLADGFPVDDDDDALDYRLSERGRAVAEAAFA